MNINAYALLIAGDGDGHPKIAYFGDDTCRDDVEILMEGYLEKRRKGIMRTYRIQYFWLLKKTEKAIGSVRRTKNSFKLSVPRETVSPRAAARVGAKAPHSNDDEAETVQKADQRENNVSERTSAGLRTSDTPRQRKGNPIIGAIAGTSYKRVYVWVYKDLVSFEKELPEKSAIHSYAERYFLGICESTYTAQYRYVSWVSVLREVIRVITKSKEDFKFRAQTEEEEAEWAGVLTTATKAFEREKKQLIGQLIDAEAGVLESAGSASSGGGADSALSSMKSTKADTNIMCLSLSPLKIISTDKSDILLEAAAYLDFEAEEFPPRGEANLRSHHLYNNRLVSELGGVINNFRKTLQLPTIASQEILSIGCWDSGLIDGNFGPQIFACIVFVGSFILSGFAPRAKRDSTILRGYGRSRNRKGVTILRISLYDYSMESKRRMAITLAEKQVNLPSRISTTIRTSLEHKDVSKSLFREAAGGVLSRAASKSNNTNDAFIEEVHGNKADFVVRQCNPTLLGLKWLLTRKQIKGTLSFASSSSALQSLAMKKPCMLLTRSPLDNFWAKAVVALAVNAASKKKNVLWAFKELLKKESSLVSAHHASNDVIQNLRTEFRV
eukprot:jgi/Bigna1/146971/aug1.125_g21679